MSQSTVRMGVLSFAHYHANFWSEVFADRGVLVGVWDDDEVRGREAAQRFRTTWTADLDALLRSCTAVAVCSETSNHPLLIERAAAHGVAVLCEKPLGTSLAECERIATAVRRAGVPFMQSFPKRFDPVSHWLREQIHAGELGTITLVRIRHGHFYGLQEDFRQRWYVRRDFAGGGALLDEGIHGADLLAWIFGMPESVTATLSDAALGLEVEDLAIATWRWPTGMLAELTASFSFAAADVSIEVYGNRGTVLVSGVDLASRDITSAGFVRRYRVGSEPKQWEDLLLTPRFKVGEFHHQNALAFLDALEKRLPPPVTLEDGLNAVRMIESAYAAAKSDKRVSVPR